MKRRYLAVFLALPLLVACGGGNSNSGPLPQQGSSGSQGSTSETRSHALAAVPQEASSGANDLLYVSNAGNDSITVYRQNASGNTAPLYVIAGSNTRINGPGQLSEDAQGNLYVVNGIPRSKKNTGVLVFAHGASGNVSPIRILSGPLTRLVHPSALTVDKVTGELFVMDLIWSYHDGASSLLRFAADATGDEAPLARSETGDLEPSNQIVSDSTNDNIIESHGAECCYGGGNGVETMAKQFDDGRNPAPLYETTWFMNRGVADDPTTKTYLTTTFNGIYRFAENTVGEGPNPGGPGQFTPSVVSIITDDICGQQMALGRSRDIYVVHSAGYCPTSGIYVYKADASGKAKPRVLGGAATGLDAPVGIYVGQ